MKINITPLILKTNSELNAVEVIDCSTQNNHMKNINLGNRLFFNIL